MTVLFADLDRTLIYSADALDIRVPDNEAPQLLCVETYQGRPVSFVTKVAAVGIARLLEVQALVPVTTRSLDQYRRVRLPGPRPRLALAANGGRLLRVDEVDEDYSKETSALLEGSTPLDVVLAHLRSVADPRSALSVRSVEDLFCYAVVNRESLPSSWVVDLADYAASVGWQVSDQGRKIYLLPNELTKGSAVRRIAKEFGFDRFLAAGDTNADESMLMHAAEALVPRHAPIACRAKGLGARLTSAAGVAAGEEVVAWAEARLLAHSEPEGGIEGVS